MKRSTLLLSFLVLSATAPLALASSFAGTSAGASSAGSSASSGSSSGDDKLVEQAREDAAGFVASEGRVRTARLEAALQVMRERGQATGQQDDLALARAILARQ